MFGGHREGANTDGKKRGPRAKRKMAAELRSEEKKEKTKNGNSRHDDFAKKDLRLGSAGNSSLSFPGDLQSSCGNVREGGAARCEKLPI